MTEQDRLRRERDAAATERSRLLTEFQRLLEHFQARCRDGADSSELSALVARMDKTRIAANSAGHVEAEAQAQLDGKSPTGYLATLNTGPVRVYLEEDDWMVVGDTDDETGAPVLCIYFGTEAELRLSWPEAIEASEGVDTPALIPFVAELSQSALVEAIDDWLEDLGIGDRH